MYSGVPSLHALQSRKKEMKRSAVAGIEVKCMHDLLNFCQPLTAPADVGLLGFTGPTFPALPLLPAPAVMALPRPMPSPIPTALQSAIAQMRCLYIPLDNLAFGVDGVLLTGRMQIYWLGQLMSMPRGFVLHADGKHKLHHGSWILMTLGTHMLRWDPHHLTLSTTFVPLVYLMCKQHESDGACMMLARGLQALALKYFPTDEDGNAIALMPGACMSDRSPAFRSAFAAVFPDSPFGTCWPHIIRKWNEGEYASKTFEHFDKVGKHLQSIHLARSAKMRDLLKFEYGEVWDGWDGGKETRKVWNSYCLEGWDCWSIGLFSARLCTPSQNTQESWHRGILQAKIPGMFKGSTESVFANALPQLIEMDALLLPSTLQFRVPAIPKEMMKKAVWYIDNQDTHVHAVEFYTDPDDEATKTIGFWVLRKDNEGGFKKITKRLLECVQAAWQGKKDRRVGDAEDLGQICDSMHFVQHRLAEWGCVECEWNPANLICSCKGNKGYGICSHVLGLNHILKKFNVKYQLASMGESKAVMKAKAPPNRVGRATKPAPALTREKTKKKKKNRGSSSSGAEMEDWNSSDEELARLLEDFAEGR